MSELRTKVLAAEAEAGRQLTWASTPAGAAAVRSRAVVSAVVGARRQYGFLSEDDREQFVYNRTDALFTVSRELRAQLELGPVQGGGVRLGPWTSMWARPAGGGAARATPAPAPAAVPVPTGAPSTDGAAQLEAAPRRNRFRKQATATS